MSENKKPFAENTGLAKRIAALAVAASILVLGPVKLNGKRNEALDVFKNGTSAAYTASIFTDIGKAASSAGTLAGIAGDEKLARLSRELLDEDDVDDMLELFAEVNFAANDAFTAFEKSGADTTDAKRELKVIESAYRTVTNDAFWRYAVDFNKERSGFPASLLALLGGAKKLPEKL